MVSHSTTSAFLLAALFVSAYGLPADITLVSAPTTVGGAYPPATPTATATAAAHNNHDYDTYKDQNVDNDKDVQDYGSDRGRGRSPSRRSGYSSDDRPRHRSRSASCDSSSVSGRSSGSDSCSDESVDDSCDDDVSGRRRHRRRRRQRCVRRRRPHRPYGPHRPHFGPHGFWHPHPWRPAPLRPWGVHPWDQHRPMGPHPWHPRPWRPVHRRPQRHPYGDDHSHSDNSDCDTAASPLRKRFFNYPSDVDRVSGLPRIYFGAGGRKGYPDYDDSAYGGADDYDQYRGDYGNDDYDGDYGNDDYGYGGDYGVDDYRQGQPRRGGGPAYGRGPNRGNHPTLNKVDKYSENDYAANASERSFDYANRQGKFSLDQRHADEESYSRNGENRVMVDRYGQRVTSHNESIDAARREADASDLHISGPHGSVDQSKRSASENTFSSDENSRTFKGPNGHASERNYSVSTSSRNVSSEQTRVVNRPSRRY